MGTGDFPEDNLEGAKKSGFFLLKKEMVALCEWMAVWVKALDKKRDEVLVGSLPMKAELSASTEERGYELVAIQKITDLRFP